MLTGKEVTKEYAYFVQKRFAGTIFELAPWFGVWFDKKEIEYIETKMQTDKLYQLVGSTDGLTKRSPHNRIFEFRRVWMNSFLQDPFLPVGIQIFIKHYIAHEFGVMQMNDQFYGTQKYKDSIDYEFTAQRWLEKCR